MMQVRRWNRLSVPGITAIVGAGGKSTVLRKIVEYGLFSHHPMMVSTTTKMLTSQVEMWKPYVGSSFETADAICSQAIAHGQCGGWFLETVEGKVHGVEAKELDMMTQLHPQWHIVVEADGAKTKWVKAPKASEPVIPSLTKVTIGVVNLQSLGMAIDDEFVHNKELVMKIVNRPEGAVMTPSMLSKLVLDAHGLFQYSRGKKILFCTGYDRVPHRVIDAFLDELTESDIHTIYLADGYRESCEIRQVLSWK